VDEKEFFFNLANSLGSMLHSNLSVRQRNFYLQPMDEGNGPLENAQFVIDFIEKHSGPNEIQWKLSLQLHKILGVE
jgi:hypothetical protein